MLVVTGGAGFLGSNIVGQAVAEGRSVAAVVHREGSGSPLVRRVCLDLADAGAATKMIDVLEPTAVVNCAALASVDECERNPNLARELNVELPRQLAAACRSAGAAFAHVSTDSVFDGDRGQYSESDETRPLNMYARSKLEGERAVADAWADALIVRTNFVGASSHGGTGLAEWIADHLEAGERINGFTDVIFSPLLAGTLGALVMRMIDLRLTGLYHLGASDSVSKYELARRLAVALDLDLTLVDPATVANAALGAPRPLDTSLDSRRAQTALGASLPNVQDAVSGFAKLRRARNVLPGTASLPT